MFGRQVERGEIYAAVMGAALVFVVLGRPDLGAATVAAVAAITSAQAARQHRSATLFWGALAVWTGSMATNVVVIRIVGSPGGFVPESALAMAVAGATIAAWVGARPLLAHGPTREPALTAFPAGLLVLLGVLVGDAALHLDIHPTLRGAGIVATVAAAPVFVGCAWLIGCELHQRGRLAEIILLVGSIGHLLAQTNALNLRRVEGIWLAVALSSGGTLIASTHPSAVLAGHPMDRGGPTIRVRLWPAVLATTAAVMFWFMAKFLHGRVGGVALAIGFLATVAALLMASREFAGPRKPFVIPFSPMDRALHSVPDELIRGSVRLIGRPVRRAGDGSIAGVEVEPSWKASRPPPLPLVQAARQVELEPWLQAITLSSAQAHLPAINSTLSGDHTFLSIRFDPAVVLHSDEPLPLTPMMLGRIDATTMKPNGVTFVVDENETPIQLGAILSPVDNEDSEIIAVNPTDN